MHPLAAPSGRPSARAGAALPDRPLSALAPGDARLLAELRRAHPGAPAALLERARPIVERTVRRLLGVGDRDREDIAQGALIEIVLGIKGFRGDCPLDAWCARVTAFYIYKQIRRRHTERQLFGPLEPDTREPRSESDSTAILRGLLVRVREHLSTMSADRARAVLLHDVFGYDLAELARITGVSVAAAQSRLSRGRRDLRKRIAEDPELASRLEGVRAFP